jgi:pSer/pThr/pTyr-binding forkhead associated (FHA) protein
MSAAPATSEPRPRLVVEVRSGARRGAKVSVDPGGTLRVGRAGRADLVIAEDASLSPVHCELAWDGETCRLRDLGSAAGTTLGGAPLDGAGVVKHGGWLRAGETTLSVHVEARSPLRGSGAVDAQRADEALAALAPRVGRLHAILDTARDARVAELLAESVDESRSLYEGAEDEVLADVAPQLVAFRAGSALLERLVRAGWGRSFGVFVESDASFKALRRHLRRFLMVDEADTGRRMYFRFYDPRVLRAFLPLATARQRDELFADVIARFVCEGAHGGLLAFDATEAAS